MGPPFPETSEHIEIVSGGFRLRLQHKIERLDGGVDLLSRKRSKSFDHAQSQVVAQREPAPVLRRELVEEGIEKVVIPVSNVDPLRKQEEKLHHMRMRRREFRPTLLGLIEHGKAASNVPRIEGAVQVHDELRSNFHSSTDFPM